MDNYKRSIVFLYSCITSFTEVDFALLGDALGHESIRQKLELEVGLEVALDYLKRCDSDNLKTFKLYFLQSYENQLNKN